jgi:hypothetical protein
MYQTKGELSTCEAVISAKEAGDFGQVLSYESGVTVPAGNPG